MAGRWLGLDLGGTNIKSVVLDDDRHLIGCDQRAAGAEHGPSTVIANLATAGIEAIERWGPVVGAAIGVPGLFDDHRLDRAVPEPPRWVDGRADGGTARQRPRRADLDHQRCPGVHTRRVPARRRSWV